MKSQIGIFVITLLFCSFLFVCYSNLEIVQGSTSVIGIINSDTVWTKINSPYNLEGNVLVNNDVTLTIDPGVTVNLNTYYIQVNGTLYAKGNDSDPINLNGGEIRFKNSSDDWVEQTGSGSIIEKVILHSTIIAIEGTSPKISKNIFDNSRISISYSTSIVLNNTFLGSSGSLISLSEANVTISGNTLMGGSEGISVSVGLFETNSFPLIEGNLIFENELGIVITCWSDELLYSPIIRNNTIVKNIKGISFGIVMGGGVSPIIINNNICNNTQYNISTRYSDVFDLGMRDDFNATYNWWGTTEPLLINQKIYDFNDDFNFGTVNYVPFLNESNPNAPTIPTFIISASGGSGGSVSPSGSVSVVYGESQAFAIVASADYHIVDVLVNGNSVGAVSSYTFNNIQTTNTISATFAPNPTPSPSPTPTPTATPTATPTPNPEEPLMLSATPKSAIVTPNQQAFFTASASGGTSPYSYQWSEAGIEVIDGAVSAEFTISKSSVGSYSFYCNVTDSQGWNANTNNVVLTVIDNPTPPPSSTFSLPLEYAAVGIAAIVGIALLFFFMKRK